MPGAQDFLIQITIAFDEDVFGEFGRHPSKGSTGAEGGTPTGAWEHVLASTMTAGMAMNSSSQAQSGPSTSQRVMPAPPRGY